MKYGDMGIAMGVKEDMDTTITACFAFTILPIGETSKATKFYLSLRNLQVVDMNGSKQGKDNSTVKLGLKSNFSFQERNLVLITWKIL